MGFPFERSRLYRNFTKFTAQILVGFLAFKYTGDFWRCRIIICNRNMEMKEDISNIQMLLGTVGSAKIIYVAGR